MIKKEKKETAKKETAVEEKVSKQNTSDEDILDEYFEEDGVCACPQCRMDFIEDDVEMLWGDLWELEDTVDELAELNSDTEEILNKTASVLNSITSLLRDFASDIANLKVHKSILYFISVIALVLAVFNLYATVS